ncbi:hypothetical protein [Saccharococcus caldoxylosilyticus]
MIFLQKSKRFAPKFTDAASCLETAFFLCMNRNKQQTIKDKNDNRE